MNKLIASSFVLLAMLSQAEAYCLLLESRKAELLRQQMSEHKQQEPFLPTDAGVAPKHVPVFAIEGTEATVTVGPEGDYHPIVNSNNVTDIHYIQTIYVEDQEGRVIAMRDLSATSEKPAIFVFEIPKDVTNMTAFSMCNKHGLFASNVVEVTATSENSAKCEVDTCMESQEEMKNGTCPYFAAIHTESLRRQLKEHQTSGAFEPAASAFNKKHRPVISFSETMANITVGENPVHPTTPSNDSTVVHYIDTIYAVDQNGSVIAATRLNGMKQPFLELEIPEGTTSVMAYSYCNQHGLFVSQEYSVPMAGKAPAMCTVTDCQYAEPSSAAAVTSSLALVGLTAMVALF